MGVGGGHSRDPNLVAWEEILNNINALFEGEDFDPRSVESLVEGVVTVLVQNADINDQVDANTQEQFRESHTMEKVVTNAALVHQDAQKAILERFFASSQRRRDIIKEIADIVYWQVKRQRLENPPNGSTDSGAFEP